MKRKLTSGTYTPTPSFLSIPEHICVADAETMTVVAIVGPNDPEENLAETIEVSRLFIASPDLLEALRKSEERISQLCEMVNKLSYDLGLGKKVNADDWTDAARDAIAKAGQP